MLQRLVHAARELGGARYAALGVPDGEGGFARFITSGMSDELIAAMGPLPRTHGMLGAMLESRASPTGPPTSTRTRASAAGGRPRTRDMRSFLGVPIVARGGIIGALYLTDKEDAAAFSDADERLIVLLAAHAAIAIENARLHERSRELSIVEERNRLARELHDSVTQQLFGVVLAAESAGELLARGDAARRRGSSSACRRSRAARWRSCARSCSSCGRRRSRPRGSAQRAAQARRGAAARVRARDRAARSARRRRSRRGAPGEVFRIAQEALQNALRHADAERIEVRLEDGGGRLVLTVADDGARLRPAAAGLRGRRLGLTSMEERAGELGGRLAIASAPGAGTTVRLEVPA